MATFKAVIFKDRQRADKTWSVFIRFTHNRKVRYILTTMAVTKKDLTASMKIKNQQIVDKCNELIATFRKRVYELDLELNDMDIDAVVNYIRQKENSGTINATAYFEKWFKSHDYIKGIKNYISAFHSFQKFIGREKILDKDITVKSLNAFCEYLKDKPCAQTLYTSSIMHMFNEMCNYYNDEDNNIIRIKHSLSKFTVPRKPAAKKRALPLDVIRKIFALPLEERKAGRYDLALDCFKLSFCLMGMNSADLYNATQYDGEYITYNRTKTMDRRSDKAQMIVRVHPCIKELVEKYKGKDHVFNFNERYSSIAGFNLALNRGLKRIGNDIGVERLQFYAARHSMATIAINKVGINKYLVNDMLCHTDPSMRITDLYIEKDFTPINDANFKLLDYVFAET